MKMKLCSMAVALLASASTVALAIPPEVHNAGWNHKTHASNPKDLKFAEPAIVYDPIAAYYSVVRKPISKK